MIAARIITRILRALHITRRPVINVYDGFGDADEVIIQGYVLKLSPHPRINYRQNVLINFFSLIRLFIVMPKKNARVIVEWNGETKECNTDSHGYFKFEWKPAGAVIPGWHKAKVTYLGGAASTVPLASAECEVFMPHHYQFNFISDIDDTFLISHSSSIFKRLYVLFTKNARSRRPFDGVVRHYQQLAWGRGGQDLPNPFFYVSSSEWNLHDYIKEFCRKQEMPRGIFLLSTMKKFHQLLASGQGKHATKYVRIVRILKAYPNHQYVLLGDNSQKDPEIYQAIVRDFPGMIYAVYIRNINKRKHQATENLVELIREAGVHCCYFLHSSEAIAHSREIGLISHEQHAGT